MMKEISLEGKTALVTGGASGIGYAIASEMIDAGAEVVIVGRRADKLQEATEKLGDRCRWYQLDVTHVDEYDQLLNQVDEKSPVDILVNNAGITNDKLSMRMQVEDFNGVLEANLTSCFIGCREALKIMRKQGYGSVVNIASIIGEIGNIGQCNYAASKGGMIAMTKSFAKEGGSKAIRFNCITPGFIQSDMTENLKEEIKASYAANIPLGRFGNGKEVAGAVAFLLSDHANYITGESDIEE